MLFAFDDIMIRTNEVHKKSVLLKDNCESEVLRQKCFLLFFFFLKKKVCFTFDNMKLFFSFFFLFSFFMLFV